MHVIWTMGSVQFNWIKLLGSGGDPAGFTEVL